MKNTTLKNRALTFGQWAVSIALIYYLLRRVEVNEITHGIWKTNIYLLIVGLLIAALSVFIRSYKWQLLLKVQGASLSLPYIYSLNFMSLFFNNFFFGSIAGDALRVYKTMNHSNTKIGSVSTIIIDRVTGVLTLCLIVMLAGIAIVANNKFLSIKKNIYIAIFICLGALFFIYLLYKFLTNNPVMGGFKKDSKLADILNDVVSSINVYKNHEKTLKACLLLSFFYHMATSTSMYFFSLAANVNLGIIHWFFIVPLVSFIVMIPISVNGIGLQEGTFFFYLQSMDIDSSSAFLISLLPRMGMLIFSLIGAILYLYDDRK